MRERRKQMALGVDMHAKLKGSIRDDIAARVEDRYRDKYAIRKLNAEIKELKRQRRDRDRANITKDFVEKNVDDV